MSEMVITVKRYDELKQYPEIAMQEFSDSMTVGVNKLVGDAMVNSPVDRDFFRSSLSPDVIKESPLNITGRVSASAPHAAIVEGVDEEGNPTEFGRRPGTKFPNITALRAWVVRTLGSDIRVRVRKQTPGRLKGVGIKLKGKLRKQFVKSEEEEAIDDVTLRIGRKIVREGIKAKHPIGRAFEAGKAFVQRLFDEASDRIARRVEGKS